MSRKIHLIMTMAGEGSRFKNAGIDMPKPLIELNGKPLFEHAMHTVSGIDIASMTFVVRKEHIDKYNIDKKILDIYPQACIIAVKQTTRGAADTAFLAVRTLILNDVADWNDSLIIMDCDVAVESNEWKQALQNPDCDGILLSFKSTDARYSYAQVENGTVISTAEKEVISDNALTSPYFISDIEDFIDAYHKLEWSNTWSGKEMYMSLLYNFLIDDHEKKIRLIDVDSIVSFGTPEELEKAKNII